MPVICARLDLDIDLAAGLRTIFRILQGAVHTIFLNCVLRNLQAGLRLLSLLLNAAGINPINLKIVVVSRVSRKTNSALVSAAIVLSERGEERKTCPVAAVIG